MDRRGVLMVEKFVYKTHEGVDMVEMKYNEYDSAVVTLDYYIKNHLDDHGPVQLELPLDNPNSR